MSGAETVVVAFARAGFEMVLSSVKAANDAERLEIEQMLAETHAQLAAIPRLAPELDAITERHRARVRAKSTVEGATAHKVGPRSPLPLVTPAEVAAPWEGALAGLAAVEAADAHDKAFRSIEAAAASVSGAVKAGIFGPADLPTEGEDPDDA